MLEVSLQGGPFDGQTGNIYGAVLKVAAGFDYGWVHSCGHGPALAWGMYGSDGRWTEPERDVVLTSMCDVCDFWDPDVLEVVR